MTQSEGKTPAPGPSGDHLESYRRMVEMQRQIIELVKKHEQSKREFEQLREQVSHEMALFCGRRRSPTARARRLAVRTWHRLRRFGLRLKGGVNASDIFPSSTRSTET